MNLSSNNGKCFMAYDIQTIRQAFDNARGPENYATVGLGYFGDTPTTWITMVEPNGQKRLPKITGPAGYLQSFRLLEHRNDTFERGVVGNANIRHHPLYNDLVLALHERAGDTEIILAVPEQFLNDFMNPIVARKVTIRFNAVVSVQKVRGEDRTPARDIARIGQTIIAVLGNRTLAMAPKNMNVTEGGQKWTVLWKAPEGHRITMLPRMNTQNSIAIPTVMNNVTTVFTVDCNDIIAGRVTTDRTQQTMLRTELLPGFYYFGVTRDGKLHITAQEQAGVQFFSFQERLPERTVQLQN